MKRYNISLEYEQLVMLSVAIRKRMMNNPTACDYWFDSMYDILSRVNKAMNRAHKEMGV